MIDKQHIPYLIRLLDDESASVRQDIMSQLASFGPTLKEELTKKPLDINHTQRHFLNHILRRLNHVELQKKWQQWLWSKNQTRRFEQALLCLSDYLSDWPDHKDVYQGIEELCLEFKKEHVNGGPIELAHFLFKQKGFTGNEQDYYNPQNSNLAYVLSQQKGIPISLSVIFIMVGRRLGLKVEGCPFPGHFLARAYLNNEVVFIDCFSGGQPLSTRDIVQVHTHDDVDVEQILNENISDEDIVKRFLANLMRAYQMRDEDDQTELMADLFKQLELRLAEDAFQNVTPEMIIGNAPPLFKPGMIVTHIKQGYHGVIVDFDLECNASDSWYYAKKSHPRKDQPWYHVLVHGTDKVTYVAQSNLKKCRTQTCVEHPLITYFFSQQGEKGYLRNLNPWPKTDF